MAQNTVYNPATAPGNYMGNFALPEKDVNGRPLDGAGGLHQPRAMYQQHNPERTAHLLRVVLLVHGPKRVNRPAGSQHQARRSSGVLLNKSGHIVNTGFVGHPNACSSISRSTQGDRTVSWVLLSNGEKL